MKGSASLSHLGKQLKNAVRVVAHHVLNEGNMLICYSILSVTATERKIDLGLQVQENQ